MNKEESIMEFILITKEFYLKDKVSDAFKTDMNEKRPTDTNLVSEYVNTFIF